MSHSPLEAAPMTNRQIRLRRRPVGEPTADDFSIVDAPMPVAGDGEVLRRTIYLSLDPYMRGRMNEARSYAPAVALDDVMVGGTVSEVIESKHPIWQPGNLVVGMDGWQQYASSAPTGLRAIDRTVAPISTALGVLGMPGLTAYVGLLDIGRPAAGETVVVSAASGAVGAVVGQIARLKGCRAVGIAGGRAKCDYIVDELGFDAAVDYKRDGFAAALGDACPNGIDVYFDNVAGPVLEAVLRHINRGARIPLCGLISQYNATDPPRGPNLAPLLINRATIRGFLVFDHFDRFGAFLSECGAWLRSGDLRYREDIVDGLDAAPQAFIGLLAGRNFGKLLVRVAPDPTLHVGDREG
jgi:NADPH-dependent curcumin reductase CurA